MFSMSRWMRGAAAMGLMLGLGGAVRADAPATKPAAKPYPLAVCVVSGEKLGAMGEPAIIQHEGREVRLCCGGCEKDFRKEPAKYLKKIDDAAAKQEAPNAGHKH